MKKLAPTLAALFFIPFALVFGTIAGTEACNLTPAQSAADAQAANAVINILSPLACDVVDIADPSQAKGVCQVITDVQTTATAIVPVVMTIGALNNLITIRPPTPAVAQVSASLKSAAALKKAAPASAPVPSNVVVTKSK